MVAFDIYSAAAVGGACAAPANGSTTQTSTAMTGTGVLPSLCKVRLLLDYSRAGRLAIQSALVPIHTSARICN